MNYKATRTPPKFQIRNKGVFIYYVINIGGRGVSQMLMFVDMGEGGVDEKITSDKMSIFLIYLYISSILYH